MLWGISEMVNARALKPVPLCSAALKTYEERFLKLWEWTKPLPKQKYVLRKCCGVSQKWWMVGLWNLSHCVQQPCKLTSRDFWSSRNEQKPLSQQKYVLRKCCGVSQKWWMVELWNLSHCVQEPWKRTGRDFWSSQKKCKPLSKQKCVLRQCCGISQKQWMLELSNHVPLCSAALKTILVGISEALGMNETTS